MEIEAIRTEYNGVMFRSKLEAHWARFFDAVNIEWEYEPTALPGWIPDFLIAGHWLAEVKPVPMVSLMAADDPQYLKAIRDFDTVLLGDGPGDALGLVVRRMKDGGVFPRYLVVNVGASPVEYVPTTVSPHGYDWPLTTIWRNLIQPSEAWGKSPAVDLVQKAHAAFIDGQDE